MNKQYIITKIMINQFRKKVLRPSTSKRLIMGANSFHHFHGHYQITHLTINIIFIVFHEIIAIIPVIFTRTQKPWKSFFFLGVVDETVFWGRDSSLAAVANHGRGHKWWAAAILSPINYNFLQETSFTRFRLLSPEPTVWHQQQKLITHRDYWIDNFQFPSPHTQFNWFSISFLFINCIDLVLVSVSPSSMRHSWPRRTGYRVYSSMANSRQSDHRASALGHSWSFVLDWHRFR